MSNHPVRLRQLVIATNDLDGVVDTLHTTFDLTVSDRIDGAPSHDQFALLSATLVAGSQFLEIIEPVRDEAPAARHLARLGGDGGYMVILEVPSASEARARAERLGVRVIWEGGAGVFAVHSHPKDTGGVLLSMGEARPPGTWDQGGPHWERDVCTTIATGIAAARVTCDDPERTAALWADLLDLPPSRRQPRSLELDDGSLVFEAAGSGRPHAPTAIDLRATDAAARGTTHHIGGVTFRLV